MSDNHAGPPRWRPPTLDYDLADTVDGTTAERCRALGNPTRRVLLDLVLERAMTVSELAARVGKAKGTVAHHVEVLVDAGLLQVVRSRKVRALEERFYGRAARTILVASPPDGELPFLAQATTEADFARMETGDAGGGFTMRHARIPAARADEYFDRLMQVALEFHAEQGDGDDEYALLVGVFPTSRSGEPARRRGGGAP